MRAGRMFVMALIGLGITGTQVRAVQLPPNGISQSFAAADTLSDITFLGTAIATKTETPTPATGGGNTFAPQLISSVYKLDASTVQDGITFEAGSLVFGYQMINTGNSSTLLQHFNVGNFSDGLPAGGYVAKNYVASTNNVVPNDGVYSNTGTFARKIGFDYVGNELAPGSSSALVLIFTHATTYGDALATLQDTNLSTPNVSSFAPTPEPGTLVMAGIALPLLGLTYLRRRRGQA